MNAYGTSNDRTMSGLSDNINVSLPDQINASLVTTSNLVSTFTTGKDMILTGNLQSSSISSISLASSSATINTINGNLIGNVTGNVTGNLTAVNAYITNDYVTNLRVTSGLTGTNGYLTNLNCTGLTASTGYFTNLQANNLTIAGSSFASLTGTTGTFNYLGVSNNLASNNITTNTMTTNGNVITNGLVKFNAGIRLQEYTGGYQPFNFPHAFAWCINTNQTTYNGALSVTPFVYRSYNVDSFTNTSQGVYNIHFVTPLSMDKYLVFAVGQRGDLSFSQACFQVVSYGTSVCSIRFCDQNGTSTNVYSFYILVI